MKRDEKETASEWDENGRNEKVFLLHTTALHIPSATYGDTYSRRLYGCENIYHTHTATLSIHVFYSSVGYGKKDSNSQSGKYTIDKWT